MKTIFPDPFVTDALLITIAKKNGLEVVHSEDGNDVVLMDRATRTLHLYATPEYVCFYRGCYPYFREPRAIMRVFNMNEWVATQLTSEYLKDHGSVVLPNSHKVLQYMLEMFVMAANDKIFRDLFASKKTKQELSLPLSMALHMSGSYPQVEFMEWSVGRDYYIQRMNRLFQSYLGERRNGQDEKLFTKLAETLIANDPRKQ